MATARNLFQGGKRTARSLFKKTDPYEQELAIEKAAQYTSPSQSLKAYGANVAQALPFVGTFTDEAMSAIGSALGGGSGEDFRNRYEDLQRQQQILRQAGEELNPSATTLGQIGAGVASIGAMPQIAAGRGLAGQIASGAKIGGGMGASYGAGLSDVRTDDSLSGRAVNAAVQGTLGALTGGALPAVMSGIGSAGKYAGKFIGGKPLVSSERLERVTGRPDMSKGVNRDTLKKMSQYLYKTVGESSEAVPKERVGAFIREVESLVDPEDIRSVSRILGSDDEAFKFLQNIGDLSEKPLTLRGAQRLDELLGEKAIELTESGIPTKASNKIKSIQSKLRDLITGGGELGEARKAWQASQKLRDIERIKERASMMDQPAGAVKTGFRGLLGSDLRSMGYTPAEKSLAADAAQSNILTDALRAAGTRLLGPMAGAYGGPQAGVIGGGVSEAARAMANRLQFGAADRVSEEIIRNYMRTPQQTQMIDLLRRFPALGAQINNINTEYN